MAGGGNFIHRVISYVANELIVNGLSNRHEDENQAKKAYGNTPRPVPPNNICSLGCPGNINLCIHDMFPRLMGAHEPPYSQCRSAFEVRTLRDVCQYAKPYYAFIFVKKTKQSPVSNWGNNLRCCLLNMPTKRPLSLYLSASFQRFAVRTNRRMEDLSKLAQQKRQEIADQVKDVSKNFESFKNQ
ncbi:putative trypsin inhibitor 1-like [Capsicum annuum]|uniref:Uncharacterized protein n=1 Tax=Capsicum annuum TaxID=4072 RepID=A0A2G2YLY7_CAPAN|nr:putative trypsin inhibitor 1-like [Capsicum annuum]KAF3623238.1 putative trypsin inhibitor 1-like [Capsicum annuum]PHT70768.1 hypothetical protein T459_25872 [Capsicum annuum]